MKLKKMLLALGFSLVLSASVFAADNMWQYNQYTSIDMNSAKLYYDMGRQILSFDTVEQSGETTDYCTYVYNIDDQTIQLKKMITKTKKHKYKSSFYPESIKDGNAVIKARARMANDVLAKVKEKDEKNSVGVCSFQRKPLNLKPSTNN